MYTKWKHHIWNNKLCRQYLTWIWIIYKFGKHFCDRRKRCQGKARCWISSRLKSKPCWSFNSTIQLLQTTDQPFYYSDLLLSDHAPKLLARWNCRTTPCVFFSICAFWPCYRCCWKLSSLLPNAPYQCILPHFWMLAIFLDAVFAPSISLNVFSFLLSSSNDQSEIKKMILAETVCKTNIFYKDT